MKSKFFLIAAVAASAALLFFGCDNGTAGGGGTAQFTVTFDSDGGSAVSPVKVDDGGSVGTLPGAPAKAPWTFGGWFAGKNGAGAEFKPDTAVSADITVYAKWLSPFEGAWDEKTQDIQLIFTGNTYMVKSGGSNMKYCSFTFTETTLTETILELYVSPEQAGGPVGAVTAVGYTLENGGNTLKIAGPQNQEFARPDQFAGAWVREDWDRNDHMAFVFWGDYGPIVEINGGVFGTYDADSMALDVTGDDQPDIAAAIEINEGRLLISGIPDGSPHGAEDLNGSYERGGILEFAGSPPANYRVYISKTPWGNPVAQDLMTGGAETAIKALPGRTPGAADTAFGDLAGLYWLTGEGTGPYNVLVRVQNGDNPGIWKYKNNVEFVDGRNVTPFPYAAPNGPGYMDDTVYTGGGDTGGGD